MEKLKIDVLLSEEDIAKRCKELGEQITRDYEGRPIHLIGVLKGSFLFLADLARQIDLDVSVDFLGLSSYGSSQETSGVVRMTSDLSIPIKDRDVLVVEDIIDTGLTVKYLMENLRTRMPRSVRICTLLFKPTNLRVEVPMDYVGFTIPDKFVIGYGLDYAEYCRNLPYIGVVQQDEN